MELCTQSMNPEGKGWSRMGIPLIITPSDPGANSCFFPLYFLGLLDKKF